MDKIKIILVDDHLIVRDGIKSLLCDSSYISIVGEASDGYQLFEMLKTISPDIIILDISLPKMSGIEIAKILKAEKPEIKLLILSMYTNEDFIFNALKAGIKGYLPKNTTRKELIEAICQIKAGNEYFSGDISNIMLKSYIKNAKKGTEITSSNFEKLTEREYEILKLILDGNTNPEIAEKLFISIRTVETHKNNIMLKLEIKSVVDLVKYAIKNKIIEI
ncbi:MAG: hypothetical protein A2033_02500 [Bacteroidetes bacterium GWA2_31_9]|nr:MAG: hypothetical protein A2033_02500 [Bacteroidetes bacterium GWA2_31_9]